MKILKLMNNNLPNFSSIIFWLNQIQFKYIRQRIIDYYSNRSVFLFSLSIVRTVQLTVKNIECFIKKKRIPINL